MEQLAAELSTREYAPLGAVESHLLEEEQMSLIPPEPAATDWALELSIEMDEILGSSFETLLDCPTEGIVDPNFKAPRCVASFRAPAVQDRLELYDFLHLPKKSIIMNQC